MTLLRGTLAPPPRTLVHVFRETVAECGDDEALDNGATVLTYDEFADAADDVADDLALLGVGPGDKVGVRIASGTTELYVAIMGILLAGAAYVPVDADDPDERARTVFTEADVRAVIGNDLEITRRGPVRPPAERVDPTPDDDAWVIFTSGSTGKPKGVAVTHRNAAAFVDAEARIFLTDAPLGVGDRVMAGLSVAFDASCEEMWLAWRYGACLVPAPRSLVRSGMDLGPWLQANRITVVSTVPTLVSLWPMEALARVRLLILGGEACPPELGARLVTPQREVWNTYGPTEATVVACGAKLTGEPPIRIGLPLDGWDLAVVDPAGHPVPPGSTGELIIGGVGLARYLDPVKDAEKYAPLPSLGWERAYRSGDLVVNDEAGLLFVGRADDQVKVGGRRIELGEIDNALLDLPGVSGAAAAVRRTTSGSQLLVGYVAVEPGFDAHESLALLRERLPAPLVPRLAVVPELPTRTSGKIDRDALPWPLPDAGGGSSDLQLSGTQAMVRDHWESALGTRVTTLDADFFDLGGGSLTAAQMVSLLRRTHPEVTVADIYDHPRLADLAHHLDEMAAPLSQLNANVRPVPVKTQRGQLLALLPLRTIAGLRWTIWAAAGANLGNAAGLTWLPTLSWWWVLLGALLLIVTPGRLLLTAIGVRVILGGLAPGSYPRGGRVHLRLWLAERFADEMGAESIAAAVLLRWYARLLGVTVEPHVDLHSAPPVTGLLHLGEGCSVEPEVDLTGHWLDGDQLIVGAITVGRGARVGARSTLVAGADVGAGAEVAPGSAVFGRVGAGEYWSGSPAVKVRDQARGPWPHRPNNNPAWLAGYAGMGVLIAALPLLATLAGLAVVWPALRGAASVGSALVAVLPWLLPATLVGYVTLALLIWVLVRLLGIGLVAGHHPVQSRISWQAWSTIRVLDEARTWLFPLYSSFATPAWLRSLGATIGHEVEASTTLMIPKLVTVADGAFLADDTLIGGYELGGGWLRIEEVRIGKHAFVGNSGMAAPGRKVPKGGLVAVLSAAPARARAKRGTSWIGSPPTKLRRTAGNADTSRTYAPTTALKLARAGVELCRLLAPLTLVTLTLVCVAALVALAGVGWWLAALASGVVLAVGGVLAAASASIAKWVLLGRLKPSDHPLWSSLVWRNELADMFVELLAAPWFAHPTMGTPALNAWFRTMGAKVGEGVWCETYWLPEADLIDLRAGVTVNAGCVVQTHLFHDRVLSMDTVTLRAGATLGPNSVILPAATIGRHATIGPVSLVMRGESVPDKTRWIGNPIAPWPASEPTTEE